MDRYAALALSILSSMAIARLLTPAELGVYSVVMVLLSLLTTVRDFGAGQYLLQAKELTEDSIRSVWAIQLCIGATLGFLTLLAATPVAGFYNDERMTPIMALLALNYLINPVGSVTYAWLMREMRFGALAWMRFLSTLSGTLVSVGLAWRGYGPISLAWGSVVTTCVNALVATFYRPKGYPWLPGTRDIKKVFSFGSRLTAASILNTITAGSAEFVLAKAQSLTAAGLFSRGNGLVQMFRSLIGDAVNSVTLPMFAKAVRESQNVPDTFLKVLAYMTAVGWSFCLAVCLLAHPMIRVLYGTQWDEAVNLTRWLALAMLFQIPVSTCQTVLTSHGAAGRLLRTTGIVTAVSLVCVLIGATVGLHWLGAWLCLAAAINLLAWLHVSHQQIQFSWRKLGQTAMSSAWVAIGAAIGPALITLQLGLRPEASLLALALGCTSSAIGFLAAAYGARHPLKQEIQTLAGKIRKPRV